MISFLEPCRRVLFEFVRSKTGRKSPPPVTSGMRYLAALSGYVCGWSVWRTADSSDVMLALPMVGQNLDHAATADATMAASLDHHFQFGL
jgi:hypothetical protein